MFTTKIKKKRRKCLGIVLVVSLLVSLMAMPMQAIGFKKMPIELKGGIQPYWLNAQFMRFNISFAEPKIYIAASVTGDTGTTYRDGVVTLEKISGSNCGVKGCWTDLSSNSSRFSFSDQSISRERGTYRLTLTITTVSSKGTEIISEYKDNTY